MLPGDSPFCAKLLLFSNLNGKNYETTNVNLPFQIIENVDEPRKKIESELQGNLFDDRGRKLRGWTNKLIWPHVPPTSTPGLPK